MKEIKTKARKADEERAERYSKGGGARAKGGKGLETGKHKSKGVGKSSVGVAPPPSAGPVMPPQTSSAGMDGAGLGAPSTGPAMPPLKRGGRVKKADGGGVKHVIDDGAGSGEGRLEKRRVYGKKSGV